MLVASKWETSLQSNAVSHWLGPTLASALQTEFKQHFYSTKNMFACVVYGQYSSYTPTQIMYLCALNMMTSSDGNIFRCAGNSLVTGGLPAQWPVTRSFDIFFDLRMNKRLGKQSWGWWFEIQSRSFWRHCNNNLFLKKT